MRGNRKNRKSQPLQISHTLSGVLRDLGVDQIVKRHSIWDCWSEIVGKEVAAHTQPEFFSGKCLFVTVDHSVWMHQLTFLKNQILKNINRELKTQGISQLRFRIGPLAPPATGSGEPFRKAPPLSRKERKEIEESLQGLESKELRAALSRLMRKDLSQKKRNGSEPVS